MDSISSDEEDTGGSVCTPPKKAKGWYRQTFNRSWLSDSAFRDWLKEDKSDRNVAICIVCEMKLKNPNREGLLRHGRSAKHDSNVKAKSNNHDITQLFQKSPATQMTLQEKVSIAEILLTGFMAEHHTPFLQADHLVATVKRAFPDSEIAKRISLGKTKASYTMQYGIAFDEKQKVSQICRSNNFSLLIDESTDIAVEQCLAVVVRYYDRDKFKVVDALLDVLEVQEASADGLYKSVKKLLNEQNIPLNNIIGFASDNCSTMTGHKSGFQSKLKKDVPHIFVIGCVCHSFALCANHACSRLPSWLESCVKNVCCFFSRSSKRQKSFFQIQEEFDLPKHRMLKLSQTRWLSRRQVIVRILEQWNTLVAFFQEEAKTDKVDGAGKIYETMKQSGVRHMLLFLDFVLKKVDTMNIEFQAEEFRLHLLFQTLSDEYRNIMSLFIKDGVLASMSLNDINPCHPSNHKSLDKLSLGGRCEAMLLREPLQDQEERFRSDALSFLVELCMQFKSRFKFKHDSVLSYMKILDPAIALSKNREISSIVPLAVKFPSLVSFDQLDDLSDEWSSLLNCNNALQNMTDLKPTEFWQRLSSVKNAFGNPKFPLLLQLMTNLLVLPHSTACVERIFSKLNRVKTKKTNRLNVVTVANRLLANQSIARSGAVCCTWEPSKDLIVDGISKAPHKRYLAALSAEQDDVLEDVDPIV